MALSPPLACGLPSEPLSHPLGAPRELDVTGCTIHPVSGEEPNRWELGLDLCCQRPEQWGGPWRKLGMGLQWEKRHSSLHSGLSGAPSTFLMSRPEQTQSSLGPEHVMGELNSTDPATSPPRLPLVSSREHQDAGKVCEVSGSCSVPAPLLLCPPESASYYGNSMILRRYWVSVEEGTRQGRLFANQSQSLFLFVCCCFPRQGFSV